MKRSHEGQDSAGGAPATRTPRSRTPWLRRAHQPVRQEHVVITGRDVEVTEDEVGVVELHLQWRTPPEHQS